MATRPLAILSVAQHVASRGALSPKALEFAVATASARTLGFLHPTHASGFADVLRRDRGAATRAGVSDAELRAADSVGTAAADLLIARAEADQSDLAWRGTVPGGPGMWTSAANADPVGAAWTSIRPWVLSGPNQFRPAAPPAVGTPAFVAGLDEVRRATRDRTPAQLAGARKWAEMPLPRYWNEIAAERITAGQLPSDVKPAEVLAALNVALMDANIACFDAKYAFWSIRPSQADTGIDVPVMLPNFPAYPSGHACLSAAAAEVLAHYFPADRTELLTTVREVADSRVYAGMHYPLDNEVGMHIGRQVAAAVLPVVAAGLEVVAPAKRGAR